MHITTNDYFVPKAFILNTFYGEKTCFCWNENKLVIFPYANNDFVHLDVLTAPASIKNIQCFEGRAFLICSPRGIYKVSKDREFAILSKNAIGVGTVFYEVLKPRNEYLYLDNKQKMTSKVLLQISSEESDSINLCCVYPMDTKNTTEQFISTITNKDSTVKNLCIIAIGKRVLTLVNETVEIIYSSIYSIRDIIPVQTNSKVAGLLFITSMDIIVMHSKDNKLTFETIFLGITLQAVCANFSQLSKDTLLLVYSDKSKLYYGKKRLLVDNIQRMSIQGESFICLQCYDSKTMVGLTTDKQLIEFSIDTVERTLSTENDTLINLHSDMLKGTNLIMDKIYKGTQELHRLNQVLITEEDKLRRISLYAHGHRVQFCPKLLIHRIANRSFLSANFDDVLPKNSWIVLNLKSECQNIYCIKKVVEQETTVDMYIPEGDTVNFLQVTMDLIAFKEEAYPWCLIKNYIAPKKNTKRKTRSAKTDFVNSKIEMIESMIKERNIDMKKLSEIKKSVRRQFN
ncbi:uncharacterized protein LOC122405521 [Colletes gigas]|uniref:uncharacterized protein LOC122405521 n=1 Tax=Colletes gigas TaxID=935657 RepID=UPI001C9B5D0A|nr:uncharacterized protein LOC122405521 [Colletes gigas]